MENNKDKFEDVIEQAKSRRAPGGIGEQDFDPRVIGQLNQVRKEQIFRDLNDLIARGPWSGDQIEGFYASIIKRLRSKTCVRCNKLTVERHGKKVEDMFMCAYCAGAYEKAKGLA